MNLLKITKIFTALLFLSLFIFILGFLGYYLIWRSDIPYNPTPAEVTILMAFSSCFFSILTIISSLCLIVKEKEHRKLGIFLLIFGLAVLSFFFFLGLSFVGASIAMGLS